MRWEIKEAKEPTVARGASGGRGWGQEGPHRKLSRGTGCSDEPFHRLFSGCFICLQALGRLLLQLVAWIFKAFLYPWPGNAEWKGNF